MNRFRSTVIAAAGLVFILCIFASPLGASYFQQVNRDGFGNLHNTGGLEVKTMAVFKGKLYVGVSNQVDGAQVLCFDGKVWQQANESGFGSRDNLAVSAMRATDSLLYVGTSNRTGGQVWAYDGKEWLCLHQGKFGKTLSNATNSMAFYRGKLYVGLWDQVTGRPTEVWVFDGEASWTQVNQPGFGSPYNLNTTGLEVSKVDGQEKLYAIVWKSFQYKGKDAGCDVWVYDDKKWTKVNAGKEGFGQKGMGRAGAEAFSIVEFQGKLHVGLWGFGSGDPWEVWAYDGKDWTWTNKQIPDRGRLLLLCIALIPYQDRLYAVATDGVKEFELWSYDGKDWYPVIGKGCATPEALGDTSNKVINAMAVYRDRLFLGVTNNKSGYRIFKSNFPEITLSQKALAIGEFDLLSVPGAAVPVQWFLSDFTVAKVDSRTGFLQALSPGKCRISASDAFGFRFAPVEITVQKDTGGKKQEKILLYAEAQPPAVSNSGREKALLRAQVYKTPGIKGIKAVAVDLSPLHMGTEKLVDDGTLGDRQAGDGVYSREISIQPNTQPGAYQFNVSCKTSGGIDGKSAISLGVTQCYTVSEIISLKTMGTGHHIPILFDLKDPDQDKCSVTVEYQKDGGPWLPATIESFSGIVTAVKGKPGNTGNAAKANTIEKLATPLPINPYVCVWQSEKDLGSGSGTFSIRLTPRDYQKQGTASVSKPFSVDNRKPPANEMVFVPSGKFSIDKYEYPNHFGYYPVVNMTWHEARKICQEQGKDLCTPEQWEMAYYGTAKKRYPYGDTYGFKGRDFCNTPGSADDVQTPSGIYENCVNDLGVYDMGGNVFEWVSLDEKNALMADQSYQYDAMIQSLFNVDDPTHRHSYLGFRCCKCEAPRPQGGASRSLILNFRYMPLDPACNAGLARHETGQKEN